MVKKILNQIKLILVKIKIFFGKLVINNHFTLLDIPSNECSNQDIISTFKSRKVYDNLFNFLNELIFYIESNFLTFNSDV